MKSLSLWREETYASVLLCRPTNCVGSTAVKEQEDERQSGGTLEEEEELATKHTIKTRDHLVLLYPLRNRPLFLIRTSKYKGWEKEGYIRAFDLR
jgi:hypothetical protein